MAHVPGGRAAVLLGLVLAIGTLGHAVQAPAQAPAQTGLLTAEEQAWLDAQPALRVGNNPTFEPIDFDDERGRPDGVAADIMQLVQKKLDLRLEYVPGQTWDEAFDALRKGEIDILLQAGRSP